MTKLADTVFLVMAALVLAPAVGYAGSSSTDWTLGPGGLYTWAGGTSSLIGSAIPVLSVLGDSTPDNNGVSLPVIDGSLSFTSGAFNGTSTTWSWGSGTPGTLNVTGCIAGIITPCTPSTNVLISDDFTSVSIVQVAGALDAVFGNVTGTISSSVAAYFGLPDSPATFSAGSFTAAIATTGTPGSAFFGSNLLGLIEADAVTTPENWGISESLVFFMIAIVVFAVLMRRGALRPRLLQDSGRS
jgi:hypothetical protein